MPETISKEINISDKEYIDIEAFRKLSLKEKSKFIQGGVLPNNLTEEEIVDFCSKVREERYKKGIQRELDEKISAELHTDKTTIIDSNHPLAIAAERALKNHIKRETISLSDAIQQLIDEEN